MTTTVIGRMEEVSLRRVRTNDERDFTPWLVENLDLLSDAVGVVLHSPQREVVLSGAGRADMVAMVASDDADEAAVIENQIGQADGDHLVRLLGYAQATGASVLIWVAGGFGQYYMDMADSFNRRSGTSLAMYLVKATAWQIGENVGLLLDVCAGPEPVRAETGFRTMTRAAVLGDFCRPLVARLRAEGVRVVGRGGYRGRWRTLSIPYESIVYSLGVTGGRMLVFLSFLYDEMSAAYESLGNRRDEIDAALAALGTDVEVECGADRRERYVAIGRVLFGGGDGADEQSRDWLLDKTLRFMAVMDPFVAELFSDDSLSEGSEGEELL